MNRIVFVHGMFQNPRSWDKWIAYFNARGYECSAPAWPMHEGEPPVLRDNPPAGLGKLSLDTVIASVENEAARLGHPIMIGHSVGGLITQIMLNRGLISAGVAIDSVAPNAMLDFDWGFIKNSAVIANPFKGDEPIYMDAPTFHASFANSLSEADATRAFEEFATHDSRNVLRDCMGSSGRIDFSRKRGPLLLIAGEKDEIIPADLTRKNHEAYDRETGVTDFKDFAGRSHYICGEPGWEEVAAYAHQWIERNAGGTGRTTLAAE